MSPMLVVLTQLLLIFFADTTHVAFSQKSKGLDDPVFAEPIPNITVTAGRTVSLPCVVDNIQRYRVAWIHAREHTLLTLGKRVITRSKRYEVSHNNHRTWYLHINNVQAKDRGEYMCQVNTIPMMTQVGYLEVVVPPYLDEERTSSDTEVREGSDVSLYCLAKGSPEPDVTWRREDGHHMTFGKNKVSTVKGTHLNFTKVSRLHMGAYLCIAANGVQPSLSKRILLGVSFTPMIWIPNQLVGAPVGSDILLQCNLESHPTSVTYWMREGGIMVLTNAKYQTEVEPTVLYKVQLKLFIRQLQPDDFGPYTCVAKNSLGETEGTIRLYEVPPPHSMLSYESSGSKSEKLQTNYKQKLYKKENNEYSSNDQAGRGHLDENEEFSHTLLKDGVSDSSTSLSSPPTSYIICFSALYLAYAETIHTS